MKIHGKPATHERVRDEWLLIANKLYPLMERGREIYTKDEEKLFHWIQDNIAFTDEPANLFHSTAVYAAMFISRAIRGDQDISRSFGWLKIYYGGKQQLDLIALCFAALEDMIFEDDWRQWDDLDTFESDFEDFMMYELTVAIYHVYNIFSQFFYPPEIES